MHPRKASRQAIKNILLGDPQAAPGNPVYPIPAVGPRVYSNRPTPFWRQELPAICVWTPEETSEDKDSNPPTLWRTCEHIVEVMFAAGQDMDDRADDFAEAIEALLSRTPQLVDPKTDAPTVSRHNLARTELGLVRDETGNVYASLKLAWKAEYETEQVPDEEGFGVFDTLHTTTEAGGNNDSPEAVDHTTDIHQGA